MKHHIPTSNLHEYMRKRRLEQGIGLRQFAAMIGVRPSNLCRYERNGDKSIRFEVIKHALKLLGIRIIETTHEVEEITGASKR